jgi:hypothetical protein
MVKRSKGGPLTSGPYKRQKQIPSEAGKPQDEPRSKNGCCAAAGRASPAPTRSEQRIMSNDN